MMECWISDVVTIMAGSNNASLTDVERLIDRVESAASVSTVASSGTLSADIKKELLESNTTFAECSPSDSDMYSPSTTMPSDNKIDFIEGDMKTYASAIQSPDSPEQQFCSSTTQPHTDSGNNVTEEGVKESDLPRRLCLVCGDVASGFHYGVASCEACKAFFKRTIQGNIEYTCPASGDCEINKRRRKACQACRFRKCLRSGMLKEGVRLDRVRGGRQKYRRNPDSSYQVQVLSAQMRPTVALEDNKMLEALASCEPDILHINPTYVSNRQPTLACLSDLYDRELVGIIGWAKQIPGFTDLTLNDQMRLLQSTWAEILTLTLAYRSLPLVVMGRLQFAADLTLDERQARECGALELYQSCSNVVSRFDSMNIVKEEYYLLKALVLANSDARLEDSHSQQNFRDVILNGLYDSVAVLRPTGSFMHVQQLLLGLPSLRQTDHVVRRFWQDVHQRTLVPLNKLFLEMLEAYNR